MDTGVLYCDDNLARLSELPDESVDLIYLDPPFFSNRVYEVVWGDEAEVRSFEDRWEGGMPHYIGWMEDRVREMHRVLKPTGSLYLHCDPHASHYLKVMLDGIFGQSMFRSEVVWKRTGSHNSARRWGPIHDVVFFYSRSSTFTWNILYQPYDPLYLERAFRQSDERGVFQAVTLTGPGIRDGESGEPWRGVDPGAVNRHWQPPTMLYDLYREVAGEELGQYPLLERLDKADEAGLIYWPRQGKGVPRFRQYAHLSPGQPVQDVITDIPPLQHRSAERRGYPTQKPEELLERIIGSSSREGEIVLDPFCGCGTTVAVAERLRREWVGIDISLTAIDIMERRLLKLGRTPVIANTPRTVEALKRLKPFEFQNWAINAINGTHSPRRVGDMGIDGFWFFTRDPVQVKQSERVGRNVVDNFETAIRRAGHDTGYIIAFSFTPGAHDEATRARRDGLRIHLVKAAEALLLQGRRFGGVELPGPQPDSPDELPMPEIRKSADLPTAEELIESEHAASA